MLTIRDKQLATLGEGTRQAFVARTLAHLRRDLPLQCAWYDRNRKDLSVMVNQAIDDAVTHGITRQSDVKIFVDCLVLMGTDSRVVEQRYPWIGEILRRPDLDGTTKIDVIHDRLVFAQAKRS